MMTGWLTVETPRGVGNSQRGEMGNKPAGRPVKFGPSTKISVRISDADIKKIYKTKMSLTDFIRSAIREKLEEK